MLDCYATEKENFIRVSHPFDTCRLLAVLALRTFAEEHSLGLSITMTGDGSEIALGNLFMHMVLCEDGLMDIDMSLDYGGFFSVANTIHYERIDLNQLLFILDKSLNIYNQTGALMLIMAQ